MAEAIALGASVIAFIQLADRVIDISKYYIEAIHDCPRDIRAILIEVSSLKAIFENLDFLLKLDATPEPILLRQLSGDDGLIEGCRKSLSDLEILLPSGVRTARGKRRKIIAASQHLAWLLRETTARKLMGDISRYKANIALALTFDTTRDIKEIKSDLGCLKERLSYNHRGKICSWLESTNPSLSHNNATKLRQDDTNLWMTQTPEWEQWLKGKTRLLWIHGIPGAGKTVLASFLIEQALLAWRNGDLSTAVEESHPQKIVCIYYYCRFSRSQDESAPLLRWMIAQLCRFTKAIPSELIRFHDHAHTPSTTLLLELLESMLLDVDVVYLIVDAVDKSIPRHDLLKVLRNFITDHRFDRIRLLATSREYYDIETCFSGISVPVSMDNPVVQDDIRRYVHSSLLSNPKFKNWTPELRDETEVALSKRAKGMFRWAVCQIDVLQRMKSLREVRAAVGDLPRTLDETYERIFQLIPEEDREFVRLALIFICGNNYLRDPPIPANVLLEAVFHRLYAQALQGSEQCLYDRDTLRDLCGCLITFSSPNNIEHVLLAHYTVEEFLYSDRTAQGPVPMFSLSDQIVITTTATTVLEVAIHTHCHLSAQDYKQLQPQDLRFYCLLRAHLLMLGLSERPFNLREHEMYELLEQYGLLAQYREVGMSGGYLPKILYILEAELEYVILMQENPCPRLANI